MVTTSVKLLFSTSPRQVVWSATAPQNAAKQADVVITMLPAAKHVKEVYLGENGVLEVLKAGSLCIDSSTIDPANH